MIEPREALAGVGESRGRVIEPRDRLAGVGEPRDAVIEPREALAGVIEPREGVADWWWEVIEPRVGKGTAAGD